MIDPAITMIQLFVIGVGMSFTAPCLLTCTPLLVGYVSARNGTFRQNVTDIVVFLTGRFAAYIFLGALAGISGAILRAHIGALTESALDIFGGSVLILLAILILIAEGPTCQRNKNMFDPNRAMGLGGLFILGALFEIRPCLPLTALLTEIALFSQTPAEGITYMFFFGVGNFLSALIVVTAATMAVTLIPTRLIRAEAFKKAWRVLIFFLFFSFGLMLLLRGFGFEISSSHNERVAGTFL